MKKTIFSLFILICAAGLIHAHKLDVNIIEHAPAVVVESKYAGHDHGLSGGEVTVYAPGESEETYQTGKTDAAGKFAFVPDQTGEWRVVVDDGTGHRSELNVAVGENFFIQETVEPVPGKTVTGLETAPAGIPTVWKALVGISLLFGIAGILYGIKSRRESSG